MTSALTDEDYAPSISENSAMEELDSKNLTKTIFDLTIPTEIRLKALRMYEVASPDFITDTISKLGTMYEISGAKLYKEYLFAICEKSEISGFLKSIAAIAIHEHDKKDVKGYEAINIVCPLIRKENTTYRVDFIKNLFDDIKYTENLKNFLLEIVSDVNISHKFRYSIIIDLEKKYKTSKKEREKEHDQAVNSQVRYIIRELLSEYLCNEKNETMYRILAGQYLMRQLSDDISEEQKITFQKILLTFAQDEKVEYNLRADAADVLLMSTNPEILEAAQKLIFDLGKTSNNVTNTIYNNAQNVHIVKIEDNLNRILEFLCSFEIKKISDVSAENPNSELSFDNVCTNLINSEKDEKKKEKINLALNRIHLDRALYGKFSCTLESVLIKIWSYIQKHEHQEEMLKRLLEELYDMAGTCSTGFVSRLINTISGFGDFNISISWRDQIVANLSGRLNARIRDMDDLALQEKVLEQLTIPTHEFENRKHFLYFFRKNLILIREEMYDEFKQHISDTDFDLYFRSAVSAYEAGNV